MEKNTNAKTWMDDTPTLMRVVWHLDYIKRMHKKGEHGETWCPLCKQWGLKYSLAPNNGHLWVTCTATKGCLQIME